MQDGDNVLGVHGVDAPLGLAPLKPEHVVGKSQNNSQLVPLAILGLRHLRDLQQLSGQLLQQLLQDLAVVHVLLDVLDDDPELLELVVDPVDQHSDQLLELAAFHGLGLDHGSLLVLLQLVLLGRHLGRFGHAGGVDGVFALIFHLFDFFLLLLVPAQSANLGPDALLRLFLSLGSGA